MAQGLILGHLLGSYRFFRKWPNKVSGIRRPRRRPSNFETYCDKEWSYLSSS